ncbi:MAG: hypothetical protein ACO3FD_03215 [Flavobacteriaceae bacterium]
MRALTLIIAFILIGCTENQALRNPYLVEASFDTQIDTRLPLYSELQQIGITVTLPSNLGGIQGIHLTQVGIDSFRAFEVACPNHQPNSCSATVAEGTSARCSCPDDLSYSLFTGQLLNRQGENVLFDLKEYSVRKEGPLIYVFN